MAFATVCLDPMVCWKPCTEVTCGFEARNFYKGGASPGIYKEGAVTNIATFHDSIQKKDTSNPTVAPSVQSNLVTILGRTAAYRGEVVYWDQLLSDGEKLEIDLKGLRS